MTTAAAYIRTQANSMTPNMVMFIADQAESVGATGKTIKGGCDEQERAAFAAFSQLANAIRAVEALCKFRVEDA